MLSASQLSFERYFEPVFKPVSFDLGAGELLLVTGSNGCGKTTLGRALLRLEEPREGSSVIYDGVVYVGTYQGEVAAVGEETGAVLCDEDKCVGCWMCVMVCSFGAIQRSLVGSKAASKCDLCIGEDMPVCVAHCPNEALVFAEETESEEKV